MALSPQSIREQQFKPARRGYDQEEVESFRTEVADALEAAQNEATAMEARARAAVARLQELSKTQPATRDEGDAGPRPAERATVKPSVDESETISRTLLLAQRTADTTIADAQAEADRLLEQAREDAAARLEEARSEAERLVDTARDEARRAGESERVRVEGEVQALLARRDFLESDVDHLEQFIAAQRERITEAVGELNDLISRVPNGLADMRRPLLSAAADEPLVEEHAEAEIAEITRIAAADSAASDAGDDVGSAAEVNGNGDAAPTDAASEAAAEEPDAPGPDETGDVWAQRDEPVASTAEAATDGEAGSLFEPDERT